MEMPSARPREAPGISAAFVAGNATARPPRLSAGGNPPDVGARCGGSARLEEGALEPRAPPAVPWAREM